MSQILPTYARIDLEFVRGEGSCLFTDDDARYLDFTSGIAVNALGHANARLAGVLSEQAHKLWHVSNLFRIPGQEALASKLADATFADLVFFTNSGAEAVECAIKTARKHHAANGAPERYRLITFEGAFHGRTLATIAATGVDKYLEGFGPPVDGFDQVPLGDLDAVKAAIGPHTAGILIEPLQGEGGIRLAPQGFLKALRGLADEHDLLLIFDEIQCGMGRTGKLFAHEWDGVAPDIMSIAKGLGGGFPIGACLVTSHAGQGMVAGTHGSTFGGNPLGMAVAGEVLDIIREDDFLDEVYRKGLLLKQKLAQIVDGAPDVFEAVRGSGLMLGLKCKLPAGDVAKAMRDQHLLVPTAGENVVRLLPPLTVSDAEIGEAAAMTGAAAAALTANHAAQEASRSEPQGTGRA